MKWLCLLLLSTCLYTQASAQQIIVKRIIRGSRFDSTAVVHDSTGNIIPYSTWSPLMASGDYVFFIPHGMSPDSNYRVLRHLSPQDKERIARVMVPRSSPNFPNGQPVDFAGKSIDGRSYNTRELKGKIVVLHISSLNYYPREELPSYNASGDSLDTPQKLIFDGRSYNMRDLKGKVVVLHASPRISSPGAELPSYNELVDSFGISGKLVFLCITPLTKADAKALLKEAHVRYAVIAGQRKFLENAGVLDYPQDIVLDKDGKVAFSSTGTGNSTVIWLEKKIRALLKE